MKKVLIVLLALVMALLCVCLVACGGDEDEHTPVQLTAPVNIRYDGANVTWDPVDGAGSYTVRIGDGGTYTVKTNSYRYQANGGEFTITITALPKNDLDTASPEAQITFHTLGSIGELQVSETGVISWDAVSGANAYRIKLDGKELDTPVKECSFSAVPVGQHTVQVLPIVDGDNSFYSSWSGVVTLHMLAAVAADSITYDAGMLRWKSVTGAKAYEVMVNGVVLSADCKTASIAYDAQNTGFAVTVKALGNKETVFDAQPSAERRFTFLDAVTGITVQDGVVTWTPVSGATGYKVRLNGKEYGTVLKECRFTGLTPEVNTNIEIKPISEDGTCFSNWSAPYTALLLAAPVLGWNEYGLDGESNKNVYWDSVANAAGYAVRITMPNGSSKVESYGDMVRGYANAYTQPGTYLIEVKAVASFSGGIACDSAYSTPITVVRLAAPQPAGNEYIKSNPKNLAEGFTVSYTPVAGAKGYVIEKDGIVVKKAAGSTTTMQITDLAQPGVLAAQTYTYKLRSTGNVEKVNGQIVATLDSLSSEAHSFQIKVLATPSEPKIGGFIYSYGPVSGANGYAIKIGNQGETSLSTSHDLSLLRAGTYAVSVCAQGNGGATLASNYTSAITVHRLEAPANVHIETADAGEGVLAYKPVEYASSYTIVFDDNNIPVAVESLGNMKQWISDNGTTVYLQSVANYYKDGDSSVYYMTSRPGETINFIELNAPSHVSIENNKLVWSAPSNIVGSYQPSYQVYYPSGEAYTTAFRGTELDLTGLKGGRYYEFVIKAVGDGTHYINSEKTSAFKIYKPETPTVTRAESAYTWHAVAGASNYAVYIDGALKETFPHVSGKTYSYMPSFPEYRTYEVKIVALGNAADKVIDSDAWAVSQKLVMLDAPEYTFSYSEEQYKESGTVTITLKAPVANALGYAYTVGTHTEILTDTTFTYCPGSAGTIRLRVYAKGGRFDSNGNYCYDSTSTAQQLILLQSPNTDFTVLPDRNIVSWANINNAVEYKVTVVADGVTHTTTTRSPSLNLNTTFGLELEDIVSLSVTVQAMGNGENIISAKPVTWYKG